MMGTSKKKQQFRYFSRQELRELFVLEDTTKSDTMTTLNELHASQRTSDPELDLHLEALKSFGWYTPGVHDTRFPPSISRTSHLLISIGWWCFLVVFLHPGAVGVSDHDLLFSREVEEQRSSEETQRIVCPCRAFLFKFPPPPLFCFVFARVSFHAQESKIYPFCVRLCCALRRRSQTDSFSRAFFFGGNQAIEAMNRLTSGSATPLAAELSKDVGKTAGKGPKSSRGNARRVQSPVEEESIPLPEDMIVKFSTCSP